ncbi:response regulator transcription factor [Paenibacillus sp. WST5]|uniref:Response regulator transcription factor n=2 Tax=Paenibacillus sedimenti TaxID=2770274 RepID=A0A926QLF3_9BACL|nr:response regulator transcription factor [Paenibacillus sedimenti]
MRDGLQTILSLQEDMHVVGMAKDGSEALLLVETLSPQVVLMDIQMPGMNGIECTKRIRAEYPGTIVLILTTFADDDYIIDALAGGATGFLLKDIPGEKLAQSIRDAVSGHFLLPSVIAAKLAARLSSASTTVQVMKSSARAKAEGIKWSEKELEVTSLMLEGKTNREIAAALFMSEGTIKNYVSGIYAKIGTNDRTVAIMTLRELNNG